MLNFFLLMVFWIFFKISNGYQRVKALYYICRGIPYRRCDDPKTGTFHYERED